MHDLAVAERAVIRELLHVVVADAALIAEARATGVAGRRADLRAAPRQRRLLVQRELMLDVPEAAGAKVERHLLIGLGSGGGLRTKRIERERDAERERLPPARHAGGRRRHVEGGSGREQAEHRPDPRFSWHLLPPTAVR